MSSHSTDDASDRETVFGNEAPDSEWDVSTVNTDGGGGWEESPDGTGTQQVVSRTNADGWKGMVDPSIPTDEEHYLGTNASGRSTMVHRYYYNGYTAGNCGGGVVSEDEAGWGYGGGGECESESGDDYADLNDDILDESYDFDD